MFLSFTLVLARHCQGSPRSLLNKPAQGRNYIHHWRKDNLCGWNSVRIWAGKWSERNDLKREFSFRGILSPWPYLFSHCNDLQKVYSFIVLFLTCSDLCFAFQGINSISCFPSDWTSYINWTCTISYSLEAGMYSIFYNVQNHNIEEDCVIW